jgi:hypothetical protein
MTYLWLFFLAAIHICCATERLPENETKQSLSQNMQRTVGEIWMEQRLQWMNGIAIRANRYFSQEYTDLHLNNDYPFLECFDDLIVFRQNHALNHGMTQAYLAVDMIHLLTQAKHLQSAAHFQNWVRNKLGKE